jgi:hypothetical protein
MTFQQIQEVCRHRRDRRYYREPRCFGDAPAIAAETIRLAAEAGLVGGSIEDATGDNDKPLYDISHATERVEAAAEAARALPFSFTLTARAENFLHGNPDLDDTIKRLQAFERAGADVLFAPGLPDIASVRAVCAAVSKPVNFMVGIRGKSFTVAELEGVGVRRVSLATSLYRAAMSGLLEAAREVKERARSATSTVLEHAGVEQIHAESVNCASSYVGRVTPAGAPVGASVAFRPWRGMCLSHAPRGGSGFSTHRGAAAASARFGKARSRSSSPARSCSSAGLASLRRGRCRLSCVWWATTTTPSHSESPARRPISMSPCPSRGGRSSKAA